MTDGCVRLGEVVICESCSILCDIDCAIDGAVGVAGVPNIELGSPLACELDGVSVAAPAEGPDDTAAAAAVA